MNDVYHIRGYKPEDHAFIMSTFLRGLYYGDSWFSQIDKDCFMANYKHVVESLVRNSAIAVACLNDDEDVIIGYSIVGKDLKTLHWIYVKQGPSKEESWRKKGIAKSLTPAGITTVTHLTTLGKSLMNKLPGAVFNPFKVG